MAAKNDFRSLVPSVKKPEDIDDYLGYVLMNQLDFVRKTSPWEMSLWDQDELQKFCIDSECIDRVYVIEGVDNEDSPEGSYSLTARMKYKEKKIFVFLMSSCCDSGFDCKPHSSGEIYVSFDVDIFYNTIISVKMYDFLIQPLSATGNMQMVVGSMEQ